MATTCNRLEEELLTDDYQPHPYLDDAGVLRAECGTSLDDFARMLVTQQVRRGVFKGVQLELPARFKRADTAMQRVIEQYERRRQSR